MRRWVLLQRWALALAAALAVAACTPAQPSPTPEPPADTVAVYATVIRRLCAGDDSFGGRHRPPIIYLVRWTDDAVGDPEAARGAPLLLSKAVQDAIATALGDLPARVVWVNSPQDVPKNARTGEVGGHGVIVTLGNIWPQGDGTVHVSASIYVASLAAAGQTYVLQKVDGVWTVTGNTGVQWMS